MALLGAGTAGLGCSVFGGEDEPSVACSPGDEQPCTCASGAESTRRCGDDGQSWSACTCDSCAPAEKRSCTCAGGGEGHQYCNAKGSGWTECNCFVCDQVAIDSVFAELTAELDPTNYEPLTADCYPVPEYFDGGEWFYQEVDFEWGVGAIWVEWSNGELASIDGMPCQPLKPGQKLDYRECKFYFQCGCCRVSYDNNLKDGYVKLEFVSGSAQANSICSRYMRSSDYVPKWESSGTGGQTPVVDPCDKCLDACNGLPGCCTGSGCVCQDACAPVGCDPPNLLCCGPMGDCFCWPPDVCAY